MTLWIFFAFLTAAAALSILVPLRRGAIADVVSAEDVAGEAVYKAQLDELDKDLARGVIDETAAKAARTEIARRLIALRRDSSLSDGQRDTARSTSGSRDKAVMALAILAVPAAALGIYMAAGSPSYPDQPLSARLNTPVETLPVNQMIARVEQHLAQNPADGRGWEVLAPVYLSLGRPEDSARAFSNAIRLNGSREDLESGLGEALVVAARGVVTADAKAAFERAAALSPDAVKPRFFLAMAYGQDGRKDEAVKAWMQLLEGADESEPWVPVARQELAAVQGQVPPAVMPGPTADDVRAAGEMGAEDRQSMIQSMVDGLQERLDRDGGTIEEWERLIRSQLVLGAREAARETLGKARQAMTADQAAQSRFDELEKELESGN
ncbi:c-type cytochrome biogenesis protein CcmI [Pannonibacter sp. Pt2]|uniref:C-type cytochrome biogenesis protein CcmI n=1 Tax=Pannonibacter anstelovis TaxID=3121537 RepID=A0ABU7ZNP1_9HYPH